MTLTEVAITSRVSKLEASGANPKRDAITATV
jgi:hypothetical protein